MSNKIFIMKQNISLLIIFVMNFFSYGQELCDNSVNFGNSNFCLPELLNMKEVSSDKIYSELLDNFSADSENLLGFYATDNILISLLTGTICESNCEYVKVWSVNQFSDYNFTSTDLNEFYDYTVELFQNNEDLDRLLKSVSNLEGAKNLILDKPVLLEKYDSRPNVKSLVIISKIYNFIEDVEILQVATMNMTIIKDKLIYYAYYSLYDGQESIKENKNKNDFFGIKFLSENKNISNSTRKSIKLGDYLDLTNHSKSNGIEYKLRPPSGWEVAEGIRPHIVKKFNDKSSNSSFMILMKETGVFLTKKEIREELRNNDFQKELIDSALWTEEGGSMNYTLIDYNLVSVDNYPFLYVKADFEGERLGVKIESIAHIWISFIEDQSINFMGFGNYQDMFQIMNSVVFLNQYR